MLSANFKPKTTAAASRGFLATPSRIAVGADKKKGRKGKGRYRAKSQKGYTSAIWGADHLAPIST